MLLLITAFVLTKAKLSYCLEMIKKINVPLQRHPPFIPFCQILKISPYLPKCGHGNYGVPEGCRDGVESWIFYFVLTLGKDGGKDYNGHG